MPLDTIYLTRHGHRLNFTVDPRTGKYSSQLRTPTGNPADPILTSYGVQQSYELAAHLVSSEVQPKPFRIYSSPFYRCLQTIKPGVEALREQQGQQQETEETDKGEGGVEEGAVLDVRLEHGVGEWFGPTSWFHHPSPSTPETLETHFPTLLNTSTTNSTNNSCKPTLIPSTRGETIAQLHNRLATSLETLIAELDAEITAYEATQQPQQQRKTSKSILICSHAAPLIALGRVLTGNMPVDSGEEDFNVFTAGLSKFVRRGSAVAGATTARHGDRNDDDDGRSIEQLLALGTYPLRPGMKVPEWMNGRGVGGGWDCVRNGDCSFLSGGAQRGWHFNGEESFDPGPAIPLVNEEAEAAAKASSTKL